MRENYSRTLKALKQYARQNNIPDSKLSEVTAQLQSLIPLLGEYSHSRVMLNRIGTALFQDEGLILTPICHFWEERSNFGTSLPLIAQKHLEFLQRVCESAPHMKPVFLVADTEVDDNLLLRSIRRSSAEFLAALEREREMIHEAIQPFGWETHFMSEYIPDLSNRESLIREQLQDANELLPRLISLAMDRGDIYHKIGIFDPEERKRRTLHVAAQYLALARYAREKGALIATHTTQNVMWYREAEIGILHNEIHNLNLI